MNVKCVSYCDGRNAEYMSLLESVPEQYRVLGEIFLAQ